MSKKLLLLLSITSSLCLPVAAEPWVKPDDYALRADIQLLADYGIISAPVTTYPLMWNSFIAEVNDTSLTGLSENVQNALLRVKHRYNAENKNTHNLHAELFLSSDSLPATNFGANNTQELEASVNYNFTTENFAGKLAIDYRQDGKNCYVPELGQENIIENVQALELCDDTSFDHSYLAYKLGNWVLRAGAVEQFWGPGVDNSLIMSSNSKPLPALSITRDKSTAFATPWLSWIGPWAFTAQMAKLESTRVIPDALLWSTRLNFRPLKQLEIAFSWSAQWGGEGQPQSMKDFFEMISGKSTCADGSQNCDDAVKSKLGNQLAGIDLRWADTIYSQPYAFYISTIGEDASSYFKPADRAYLAGLETTLPIYDQNIKFNIEYIDTGVSCFGSDEGLEYQGIENCYYEHTEYHSGYRYHGRTIGSSYDNDAQSYVFTALGQLTNGNDWQLKLRQIAYNSDDSDRYSNNPDLGNSITKNAIDSTQLEFRYRMLALKGRITLGAFTAKNDYVSSSESDTNTSAFLKYEFNY